MANPTFQRSVSQASGSATAGGFALEAGGNLADIKTALEAIETAVETLDNATIADDAAFTAGATSVQMGGFFFDDSATDSVDEGDAGAGRMSANRNQYVMLGDGAGNERRANVNASNELLVAASISSIVPGTGATNLGKLEDSAHASGDTGAAVWGVRNDVLAALGGTDGDYVPFQMDTNGALYTVGGEHIRMVSVAGTQATATSTSVVGAPGVGKAILILGGSVQQNAASPGNAQRVAIENGTGGDEKAVVRLSANDGAGMVIAHPVIMSANNAVHLDSDQADSFVWSLTYTVVDM